MTIKFNTQYKSINQFTSVDFADFTILTGPNGSGKTHLLRAIKEGNVVVEGIPPDDFRYRYFSYSSFAVSTDEENEKYRSWNKEGWFSLQEALRNGLDTKEKIKDKHPNLYEALERWPEDLPLNKITKEYFQPLNLLLQDITKAEEQYHIAKFKNTLIEKEVLSGELATIDDDPPSVLLNEVLAEYDCNGYQLASEPNNSPQETDEGFKVDVDVKVALNREDAKGIAFSELFSGERTLMALAMLIFKAQLNNIPPQVLLLDEIDASLHPSMIERMIHVIQTLFIEKYGMKVILATHSPTTVALGPEDSIFVISNEDGQTVIQKQDKRKAINTLSDGFITLDKGLQLLDQVAQQRLNIFTEGNNTNYIEKAISLLAPELSSSIKVIDTIKDRTGHTQLKVLYEFFLKLNHSNSVLFVYDCDVKGKYEQENNTFCYTFPKNGLNKI
ncbi:MAG: ATP-binding protein, partial [Tunicatimonas sp.]